MNPLRRLFVIAALLLAAAVVAALLLPRLVDGDTLRSMLVIAARSQTGRELSIEGDIHLALLPRPAVVLPRLALADAVGFGPEPFATLEGARANLRLWPLLRGRLQVASVRIDRPQLRLTVDARGRRNWADLLPQPEPARRGPSTAGSTGNGFANRIGIGQVTLRDADILWTDRRSGRWARLRGLDLDLGGLDPGRAIPLTANAVLDMGDPPRSARLDLSATVQRAANGVWRSPNLRIGAELSGAPLRAALTLHLAAKANYDPAQARLRLRQLALAGDSLQVGGELTMARSGDAPVLGAQLRVERLDARALAARLGLLLTTADPAALSSVTGSLDLSATASEINLARIELAVDDSPWRGNARISNVADPALRFALEAERLDLDRYLPPSPPPDSPPEPAIESSESAPARLADSPAPTPPTLRSPAESLRRLAQLGLDGTLNLASLTVRGLILERVALRARSGGGRFALEPLNASLYGGAVDASLQADARGREPTLRLKLAATDVAGGPLLAALTGRDTLQGRFSLGGEATAGAATGDALLRSLHGTLRLQGSDGVLKGINADRSICQARAAIDRMRGKAVADCDPNPDTRFSALRMSGPVTAGVWRSDDVFLEQQRYRPGRFYRLTGAGTLDLASGEIDYRLRAAALRRSGVAADQEVKEALVPLRVRGRPGDFKVRPELTDAVRDEALRKLRDKLAPGADPGADSSSKSRGKNLLRGLFGR